MCWVAISLSSQSSAVKVLIAPTASVRSRPPTPIACEIPSPAWAIRQDTSCIPVPEAPTIAISPRGTTLAKASGTPSIIAVPQSGPITTSPRSRASRLREISSARATLSLKIMTLRPALSALRASAPAKSPGTEIKARFAFGSWRQAERKVSGRSSRGVLFCCAGRSINSAARCSVESAMARSCARTATSRSPGPALVSSSRRPASERMSQWAGVAIIRAASSTP